MTDEEQALLFELKEDVLRGKEYRKTRGVGDVAKHYRAELARMQAMRRAGYQGRIEFRGWI